MFPGFKYSPHKLQVQDDGSCSSLKTDGPGKHLGVWPHRASKWTGEPSCSYPVLAGWTLNRNVLEQSEQPQFMSLVILQPFIPVAFSWHRKAGLRIRTFPNVPQKCSSITDTQGSSPTRRAPPCLARLPRRRALLTRDSEGRAGKRHQTPATCERW